MKSSLLGRISQANIQEDHLWGLQSVALFRRRPHSPFGRHRGRALLGLRTVLTTLDSV